MAITDTIPQSYPGEDYPEDRRGPIGAAHFFDEEQTANSAVWETLPGGLAVRGAIEDAATTEYVISPVDLIEVDEGYTEKYRLGSSSGAVEIDPSSIISKPELEPLEVFEIEVSDPYVEAIHPVVREDVSNIEFQMSEIARLRLEAGMWERKEGTAYVINEAGDVANKKVWGDPVTMDIFFDNIIRSPAMRVWRDEMVPKAVALAYLADPMSQQTVTSKETGETYPVDDECRKWWALCTDAVAIRSRGTVMAELVQAHMDRKSLERNLIAYQTGELPEQEAPRWMSIACGTALPTMKAAVAAGVAPKVTLIDFDKSAMKATQALADEIGFEGEITQKGMNIFKPERMAKLKKELEAKGELPELVDMMGIFEYTGTNLGVDPVPFLKSGYDLVAPGGTLIFGQMRDDRPVANFTNGVVGWPHVEQRSPEEVMQLIVDAGIDPKQVRIMLPKDGVYTVIAVDKPADTAA